MKKEDDVLLNELTQSNRLLAEANRKILKRLNASNAEIEDLKEEIRKMQSNSIDSKHLNIIKEKINRKSLTLIKLNKEVELLRKENLPKEDLNKIIRELGKQVKLLTTENDINKKDKDRITIILKEKDEIIKDLMKETDSKKSSMEMFHRALLEMQSHLQSKDALIVKLNNEVEKSKIDVLKAKKSHKETAEKLSAGKQHVKSLASDNKRLVDAEEKYNKVRFHLGKMKKEKIVLKEEIARRGDLINRISEKKNASEQALSDNLTFLMQLKNQLDKADMEQQKALSQQKQAVDSLLKKFKKK